PPRPPVPPARPRRPLRRPRDPTVAPAARSCAVMLGAAADAGNPSAPKESPGSGLVTPDPAATCDTTRYLARRPALFYGNPEGRACPSTIAPCQIAPCSTGWRAATRR